MDKNMTKPNSRPTQLKAIQNYYMQLLRLRYRFDNDEFTSLALLLERFYSIYKDQL